MMRDHGGNLDAAKLQYGGDDWIDLSTGINRSPYPLPHIPLEAWTALPLKSATAALCTQARATYHVAPQAAITALAGAQGAIQLLPHLGTPGHARIFGPTYNEHAACLIAAGWRVETVSSLTEIEGADLGVVVNPNNPTGHRFSPEDLLSLRAKLGTLIVDESFADPSPELSLAPHCGAEGLFVLRSFGKFYGLAGLRLGFVIGASAQIDAIREMAGPWPISGPAIEIGRIALADATWAAATTRRLRAECVEIDKMAAQAGWKLAGGAELFRLYSSPNARAAQERLARHQIWSRIFPWSDTLIRLGLPSGPSEWGRLRAAMEE